MAGKRVNPKSLANLRPWAPGVSGNPAGRMTGGATVAEWVNVLIDTPEDALRRLARDKAASPAKRGAAVRILRMIEDGDLADFVELAEGTATIADLRKRGVPTHLVKKLKVRQRMLQDPDGNPVTETTREIELHDRSGDDFDRILDRTVGRPRQAVQVEHAMPMAVEIVTPMTSRKKRR